MSDPAGSPATLGKSARNERTKITATWLNGAAIAALAVGCFAPITASFTAAAQFQGEALVILVAGWLGISAVLHLAARRTLRRIEE